MQPNTASPGLVPQVDAQAASNNLKLMRSIFAALINFIWLGIVGVILEILVYDIVAGTVATPDSTFAQGLFFLENHPDFSKTLSGILLALSVSSFFVWIFTLRKGRKTKDDSESPEQHRRGSRPDKPEISRLDQVKQWMQEDKPFEADLRAWIGQIDTPYDAVNVILRQLDRIEKKVEELEKQRKQGPSWLVGTTIIYNIMTTFSGVGLLICGIVTFYIGPGRP